MLDGRNNFINPTGGTSTVLYCPAGIYNLRDASGNIKAPIIPVYRGSLANDVRYHLKNSRYIFVAMNSKRITATKSATFSRINLCTYNKEMPLF